MQQQFDIGFLLPKYNLGEISDFEQLLKLMALSFDLMLVVQSLDSIGCSTSLQGNHMYYAYLQQLNKEIILQCYRIIIINEIRLMELSQLINTSVMPQELTQEVSDVQKYIQENFSGLPPNFYDNPVLHQQNYTQQSKELVSRVIAITKLLKEKYSHNQELLINQHLFCDIGSFYLNWKAFLTTIQMLGTPQQVKYWQDLITDIRITGGYAQTEVAHGSNVQGLETQAVFDEKDDTFIFNSPSVSSYKLWPAMIGHYGTHMVLQAVTFSKNKSLGIQTFVVPIRDSNFKPYENVDVGDQGMKLGFLRADNGYLGFNNYKVPRSHLLQRYIKVERDGSFIEATKDAIKFGYGSMLNLRVYLSNGFAYSALVTSSLAYEFQGNLSKIDSFKLIRSLATNFSVIVANRVVSKIFEDYQIQLKKNDPQTLKTLNVVHLYSSAIKSVSAWESLRAIREAVQIAPFGNLSVYDLVVKYGDSVPIPTYEGDNNVLLQQSAKYLMKTIQDLQSKKPAQGAAEYFNKYNKSSKEIVVITHEYDINLNLLLGVMERFAFENSKQTAMSFAHLLSDNTFNKTWNELTQVQMNEMSKIFTYINIFRLAHKEITQNLSNKLSSEAKSYSENLLMIYGLHYILDNNHQFKAFKIIDVSDSILYDSIAKRVEDPQSLLHYISQSVRHNKYKHFYDLNLNQKNLNPSIQQYLHSKL